MELRNGHQQGICNFTELRKRARKLGPRRVGVVNADTDLALEASAGALSEGLALPVLIGDERAIRERAERLGFLELLDNAEFVDDDKTAAQTAVRMVRAGKVEILFKGGIRTNQLLHPVLDRESGLRTGSLLCDVALFQFGGRLVALSDCGLIVQPTLEQKKQIARLSMGLLNRLGVTRPKVAFLSAVDDVSEAIPSSGEAQVLAELGAAGGLGEGEFCGPLAIDSALIEEAARDKGIEHPVAGHADCLIVPNVEVGNMLAKSVPFLAGLEFGNLVVGAKVPILVTSRAQRATDKVNAIALGVLYCAGSSSLL